jgi:glycosyltransferase involved in cell wall biosynthesis
MVRIVSVYDRYPKAEDVAKGDLVPRTMAYIRWLKIAEKLARLGYEVDVAVTDAAKNWHKKSNGSNGNGLRKVPLSEIDWSRYDVVKTVFHSGFNTLEAYGGADHPFIISKLGSVVGPRDLEGIYFYGETREALYATQERINRASKYVTVLSPAAGTLWEQCFGAKENLLLVPGGVDGDIPAPSADPYPDDGRLRVLFAGNIYTRDRQPEANAVLVGKLNRLGRLLSRRGARLYMLGVGELGELDLEHVTYLGAVAYDHSWDYFHHAHVGVVVAAGSFNHNNESTKIYHYLRAGLPIVSEAGFPNDHVVTESRLGFVAPSEDMETMADMIHEAARREWDRTHGVRYVLENHTWEKRVETYQNVFRRHFGE